MKHLIPHKFTTGDTISTRALNENAATVWRYARELRDRAYHRWCAVLDFGEVDWNTYVSNLHQFKIKVPFKYDLLSVSLFAEASTFSDSDLTLSVSGGSLAFSPVVLDSDYTADGERAEVTVAQGVHIPEDTELTFSIADGGAGIFTSVQVVLECRYDCLGGVGQPPDPPRVRDGETIAYAEWNTWFDAITTVLTAIQTGLGTRKWFEVQSYRTQVTTIEMVEAARLVTWASDATSPGRVFAFDSAATPAVTVNADYYDAASGTDAYTVTALASADPAATANLSDTPTTSTGNDADDVDDRNQITVTHNNAERVVVVTIMEAS